MVAARRPLQREVGPPEVFLGAYCLLKGMTAVYQTQHPCPTLGRPFWEFLLTKQAGVDYIRMCN